MHPHTIVSVAEAILELGLRNPYDPDNVARRRELDRERKYPQTVEHWRDWWHDLPPHLRTDDAAAIVLFIGSTRAGGAPKRVARDLPSDIRDACAEVASRSIAVTNALDAIVGDTNAMREVRFKCWAASFGEQLDSVNDMAQLFQTTPVLIHGETGSGKELVAKALSHSMKGTWTRDKQWKPAPNEAVHLASVPPDLVQSELFGHEAGAFSGAIAKRDGVLARCHNGVVFLDEIAELPPSTQVALLRTLQEGKARRIGGNVDLDAAPRVVSATHRDLDELVADGRFRLDLVFRLSSVVIEIPPLRDRASDIPLLVEKVVNELASPSSRPTLRDKCNAFVSRHQSYDWPGNVRELHAIVRTIALGLTPALRKQGRGPKQSMSAPAPLVGSTWSLQDAQRWYCERVLRRAGTQTRAAEVLQIDRGTLRRHLAKSGDDS